MRRDIMTRQWFGYRKAGGCSLIALVAAAAGGFAMPASAQDRDAFSLEEVIVTAQFRAQNLQRTPVAITAITAGMLEARSQISIDQVANQAPNVTLRPGSAPFGPSLQAFIRGVGQADFNYALEPGVGMYVDDVYYSTLTGSIFDLLDLERVEILRGPQGTLAGQNSIGGAVKLFSKKPDGEGGGFVQATYGSYDRTEFRGAAGFTLVEDKLFARIAGSAVSKDGYVTSYDFACTHPGHPASAVGSYTDDDDCVLGTEGGKSYVAVRGALRYKPNEKLDINIIGDYTNDDSEASPFTLLYVGELSGPGANTVRRNVVYNGVILGDATGSPFISYSPYGPFAQDTFSTSPYINYSTYTNPDPADNTEPYSIPRTYRVSGWGVSGSIDYQINEQFSLKSITAYRYYESDWSIDEDGSPLGATMIHNNVWHKQFSQEVRLNGTVADAVDFTVGAFYFDQKSHYGGRIDLLSLQFIESDDIPGETIAGFAHVDWSATEKLNIVGGVRYTDQKKDFTYGRLGIPGNTWGGLAHPALRSLDGVTGSYSGDRWDYRLAAQYQWTDSFMTYLQWSTGFKGGGINPRPFFANQAQPHDPETLDAFEIGVKSDWMDNRVRLNLSAFLNKYHGILMTVNQCPAPATPTPCAMPVNAGEADVWGFEAELEAQPVEGLSIDASLAYLGFKYTELTPAAVSSGITLDMDAPAMPHWQASFGAQYAIELGNAGSITPRVDVAYKDGFFASAINRAPYNVVSSYTLVNGRITWRSPDEDWQIALEVTNLTDKLYYLGIFDNRGSSQTIHGLPAAPRQWAVTVKRNF